MSTIVVSPAINRISFYAKVRNAFGPLKQTQVDGFDAVLNEWQKRDLKDMRWVAYILATVWHETAKTMQPVEEDGKGKGKDYGKKLKMGNGPHSRVGYTTPDKIYYGRGYTQNTWFENYDALTKAAQSQGFGWDFLNNPELLLQPRPSIWATFHAMTTGLYTGRKLSQYFNDVMDDNINARRIINGNDQAERIKGYALTFRGCFS
jgi:putative chitinase